MEHRFSIILTSIHQNILTNTFDCNNNTEESYTWLSKKWDSSDTILNLLHSTLTTCLSFGNLLQYTEGIKTINYSSIRITKMYLSNNFFSTVEKVR